MNFHAEASRARFDSFGFVGCDWEPAGAERVRRRRESYRGFPVGRRCYLAVPTPSLRLSLPYCLGGLRPAGARFLRSNLRQVRRTIAFPWRPRGTKWFSKIH
jgi:hypothetical protein